MNTEIRSKYTLLLLFVSLSLIMGCTRIATYQDVLAKAEEYADQKDYQKALVCLELAGKPPAQLKKRHEELLKTYKFKIVKDKIQNYVEEGFPRLAKKLALQTKAQTDDASYQQVLDFLLKDINVSVAYINKIGILMLNISEDMEKGKLSPKYEPSLEKFIIEELKGDIPVNTSDNFRFRFWTPDSENLPEKEADIKQMIFPAGTDIVVWISRNKKDDEAWMSVTILETPFEEPATWQYEVPMPKKDEDGKWRLAYEVSSLEPLLSFLGGIINYADSHFWRAGQCFDKIKTTQEKYWFKEFYIGLCHQMLMQHKLAISRFLTAVDMHPDPLIYNYIAVEYIQLENYQEAERALKRALELDPDNLETKQLLASVWLNLDMAGPEPEGYLQEVLEKKPTHVQARKTLIDMYLRERKYKEAVEQLAILIQDNPTAENLLLAFELMMEEQQFDGAAKMLIHYNDILVPNPTACFKIGQIYLKYEKFKKAKQYFEIVIRLMPEYADAYFGLGICNLKMQEIDLGLDQVQHAIELDEDNSFLRFELGRIYFDLGRIDECIDVFTEYIKRFPDNASAYFQLGLAYLGAQKYKKAADVISKSIQLEPNHLRAYYNLGQAYEGNKQYRDALNAYQMYMNMMEEQNVERKDLVDVEQKINEIINKLHKG